MSQSQASAPQPPATPWGRLRPLAPALGVSLILLGLVFHTEIGAAVHVWNTSTAYGHCWLVPAIAAWLLWERRFVLAAAPALPTLWPVLLALPVLGLWVASDLIGVMEGRQFAALGFVEILLLAACGPRLWWALSPGFLYLAFLVPFGAFLTPYMQDFTAGFVAHGLDILGIPNRVTQLTIEIPEGTFYVAEACAGLRFLIASIAFGVLYAVTMFVSPWRRVIYIAIACTVPVIANGFRALGIVSLGHVLGSAQAAATDHVLYGWIFFSFVILLLAAVGMPFREDPPPCIARPEVPAAGSASRAALVVLPVLVLGAVGPLTGLLLEGEANPGRAEAVFTTPAECEAGPAQIEGDAAAQDFVCGQLHFSARAQVLPVRANPARVVAAARDLAGRMLTEQDLDFGILQAKWGAGSAQYNLMENQESGQGAAFTIVVDGEPHLGGLTDRLLLARRMLAGMGAPSVALAVAVTDSRGKPGPVLADFLAAQVDLPDRVSAMLGRQ